MPLPGQVGEGDGSSWAMFIAICSVCVNAVGLIITGAWTLARTRNATDEKVAERRGAAAIDMVALERRLEASIDNSTRQFGETVTAIRAKVTETELWNRDNFVSKETFQTVIGEMKNSWERFEDNLNARFNTLDEKLDRRNKGRTVK
jgi:hypothetical protein